MLDSNSLYAVSYTHLDVYKRQLYVRLLGVPPNDLQRFVIIRL